jgi:hypothetical protein
MIENETLRKVFYGMVFFMVAVVVIVWGSNIANLTLGSPQNAAKTVNSLNGAPSNNAPSQPTGTCGASGGGCGGGTNANSAGTGTVQAANLQTQTNTTIIGAGSEFQEINMTVDNGWLPGSFVVKTGVPVRWNVYVKQFGGCINGLRASDLGIDYQFQRVGETKTFEFTPTKAGTIYFTCLMGMARGQIEVRDDVTVSDAAATNAVAAKNPAKKTGGCGCGGGSGSCGG